MGVKISKVEPSDESIYVPPIAAGLGGGFSITLPNVDEFSLMQGPKGINICSPRTGAFYLIRNAQSLENLKACLDTIEVV